ncbi:quinoprotein glucose dehydrogenase (plasmid) [Ketogulonicigenium robustum]|uniref:Quinoprotein glucose dehydrogenase n=1 Tax=Ketogulonicigenium robustum TaxID=92947 RepID=A0A1W6P3E0_9RHOB|nr:quinoprotein glucose dehydrogenase [Ketogulonicigenium robustum]
MAAGLFFTIGGGWLIGLGGSWYFLIAGLVLIASGVLIICGQAIGAALFGLTFIATVVWGVWEVGFTFWPLVSRLFAMAVGGIVVALSVPLLTRARTPRLIGLGSAVALVAGVVITAISAFSPKGVIHPTETAAAPQAAPATAPDWSAWGANDQGHRFAALDDITPANVNTLEVAWTAHTGETPQSTGSGAEDQNTPLQIGNQLIVCTAYGTVISYNVDTGAENWRNESGGTVPAWQRCRGVAYFDAATASFVADEPDGITPDRTVSPQRVFVPTVDARLIALDITTGERVATFGEDGVVDLKIGMGEVKPGYYQQTSTPLVAGNLVIVGGRVADNNETGEPPGVVRAFSAETGALVWAWDPGNPAVTREPLDEGGYTRGTPNVWSAMSFDPDLGLVYLPTGNATPDFWAGERTEMDDLYSSSVVALNVSTGRVQWHFQTVHHDLWDFDIPAQPVLYDIPNADGTTTPAVVTVSKTGMIYLLNRATGEPLADIVEQPVPQGNVEGERYSPTQPYSIGMPMIGNATLTEADMWGATPFDQLMCRIQFKGMRHEGIFTPPGLDHALQMPGSLGGMNWGSVSIDPTTSYMYVNDMRLGLANYLIPRDQVQGGSGIEMGVVPQLGTPFGAMRERFLSPLGVPCQAPPFGTLTAVDLKTHALVWQVPVGTVQDTGPMGIRMGLQLPVGMPTLGPTLATQSGLIFIAGTQDFYLRAYDSRTGAEVWKARLPVGSQGGPMTFRSPDTGRQYVVITAGGARQSPDRGDYVIAYALPS